MAHDEASLKALKVPELKELLSKAGLPVSGKKEELIARLLADSSSAGQQEAAAPATSTSPSSAAPATTTEGKGPAAAESGAPATADGTDGASANDAAVTPAKPVELTAEEKAKRLEEEEAKRQARSARFGASAPSAEQAAQGAGDDKLKSRAERFGLAKDDGKGKAIEKSIDALDRPLGEKRQRQSKADKPAAAAAAEKKAPAAKAVADPEMAKKIAEDEEKKRKRAERFGAPAAPADKKAKVSA